MWNLAAQIVVPLLLAGAMGFACAWLLNRQAVLSARAESADVRARLEKLSAELQQLKQHTNQIETCRQLDIGVAELRVLESELESILSGLGETRQVLG